MDNSNDIDNNAGNGSGNGKKAGGLRSFPTVAVFVLLFAVGLAAGYFFLLRTSPGGHGKGNARGVQSGSTSTAIQLFFPSEDRLKAETRTATRAASKLAAARATVEEFLKGPSNGTSSYFPEGARLLGIYDGADGVLYVDISDEFRRNLQADALTEMLLLRGLYESVLANVYGVADVKVLIEGAEVETLAGHISIERPLGETVSQAAVAE